MAAALSLQIIHLTELQSYQQLYKCEWPKYCAEYYCLDNFIRLLKARTHMPHLTMYTLSAVAAQAEGLFLIVDRYQLFVGCLDNAAEGHMQQALSLLDWSTGLKCSSIPARHHAALTAVVQEKKLQIEYDSDTHLYFMPTAEALQLKVDLPAGYTLKDLSAADAPLIDEHWPNRHLGSLFFIKRQIENCVNVGLYETATNQLVAWCILLQGGYMGALQVRDTHLRRGFGSLVTKAMAQRMAALGTDAMALVNPTNASSCGMFDKLGFKVIDQCHWLRTLPIAGDFNWTDAE